LAKGGPPRGYAMLEFMPALIAVTVSMTFLYLLVRLSHRW
jgi:hypothetical protein